MKTGPSGALLVPALRVPCAPVGGPPGREDESAEEGGTVLDLQPVAVGRRGPPAPQEVVTGKIHRKQSVGQGSLTTSP